MDSESKSARRGPWIIAAAIIVPALLVLLGGYWILEIRERSEECEAWRSAVGQQVTEDVFDELSMGITTESEVQAEADRYAREAAHHVGPGPPGCDYEGYTGRK